MPDSSIDSAAIREIERLVLGGVHAQFERREGDPPHVIHLLKKDGSVERQYVTPAPIASTLRTPQELVSFAIGTDPDNPIIFYDEKIAVLVLDRDERRDRASCPMPMTPQFTWLSQSSKGAMSQADFVRLLRITFRGCLPTESGLLPLVRQLKWSSSGAAEASLRHGAESMGRTIQAQVTGEAAIPEELSLHVPVWENFPFRAHVHCAIEVLPHEQQFRLTPFPLEMRAAMDHAMESLGQELSRSKLPCFCGMA